MNVLSMREDNLNGIAHFNSKVVIKFQLYNSLFSTLPFHRIEKTGILLPLFQNDCEEGFKRLLSPTEIIETFFEKQKDRLSVLNGTVIAYAKFT